jgi:hypothetical protein
MRSGELTILLSGMIAADPHQGGATWAVLQYVLGLRELGHRVVFVEPVQPSKVQPAGAPLAESVNAGYFHEVASDFALDGTAALLLAGSRTTVGLEYRRLLELAREADLLINISGMLTDPDLLAAIGVRVYLDLDPGFIQLWSALGIDMRFAGHTHFATVGQAIGEPGCSVPTCGLTWIKTLPPVVLAHWPVAGQIIHDGLTTVGNWRAYGSLEYEGVHYGQKAHSLRPFFELPRLMKEKFLVALAIDAGEVRDIEALHRFGWQRLDPAELAATPDAYRRFVQGSKAEFGIAKSGYVLSRCGWFSDRSACYLASGRPVIAQETGFSRTLPTGAGLFAFATAPSVVAASEEIHGDYARHRRAARELAEEYFASERVLPRLLDHVGAKP